VAKIAVADEGEELNEGQREDQNGAEFALGRGTIRPEHGENQNAESNDDWIGKGGLGVDHGDRLGIELENGVAAHGQQERWRLSLGQGHEGDCCCDEDIEGSPERQEAQADLRAGHSPSVPWPVPFARSPKTTPRWNVKRSIIRRHPMSSIRALGLAPSSLFSPQSVCPRPPHRLLALAAVVLVIAVAPAIEAAPGRHAKASAKGKHAPSGGAAKGKSKAQAEEEAADGGKVAVLAFDGQDTYSVRDHVIKALSERGMKVEAAVPSVDTVEQYRDMGAVLDLAVYVHGHVKELPADHAVATIVVRSGVNGEKLTAATFTGYRRGLPEDVEEMLWQRLGATLARACVDARKPRPHHNKPTVIEAGTPL